MLVVSPLFVLIGLLSVLAARRLAAPIRNFAAAAERLGVDSSAPPLPELGPHELRAATRAFNRMQERLRRFVEDRTTMLAVMSHDLRTPLNRLRLRAEFIDDEEQQRKMFGDLEAMNTMIDATLDFARDDVKREPRRLLDLGILIEDICEDAVDAGASVTYSGPRGVNICCRPTAVCRIVANLVDNAVRYGGTARVDLARKPGGVVVTIDDDGPGIPIDEHEKVFAPFYQLDRSRNRDAGGVGLGLSVARTIAREHGGDVTLANRAGGGFRARVKLPL
ncbi:MAG: HAMP domain-containing protein [Alphaproteobacteria bacterium]|nr:HAMP domain-containing protein [Alphaproteobacteria bacterium]MBV8410241.1 HAMP domain-containing protein [Alphaproteobacteria bacterium]